MKTHHLIVISLSFTSLLIAGCNKEKITPLKMDEESGLAEVNVHVDDFSVSEEGLAGRKDLVGTGSYNGINAITLAFYNGSTEVSKITQLKVDSTTFTTFGDFNCSLRMGSYTMVVVAYTTKADNPFVLTSPTLASYTGLHAYETFVCTKTVNIDSTVSQTISATLNRVGSMLQVVSTDGKSSNASKVRMTMSAGGRSFNPTTGLATVNSGFANVVSISAAVGSHSTSSTYLFLMGDEQTMDVTIDVLDADSNSISHKVVTDVPFKSNRKTILTGSLYTAGANSAFVINTGWIGDTTLNF